MTAASLGLSVGVHVHPETEIRSKVYPEENRATVTLDGAGYVLATLFANREGLVRLRATLGDVLAELDAELAKMQDKESVAA